VRESVLALMSGAGAHDVAMRVVHSVDLPHVELVQAVAGTVFQPAPGNGWHHVAFWSPDLGPDVAALERQGYTREAWGRGADDGLAFFAYLVAPSGHRVELVNVGYRAEYEAVWARAEDD
jgi:catechol 2,3-dioxygenase-like lactoylglutathione lyase family enzyme